MWGDYIIRKNFVAYTVLDNNLILCEENTSNHQNFYTFNLRTEDLKEYKNYSDLNDDLNVNKLKWEPLWVREFEIQKN